jgi:hypothetical protein
MVPRSLEPCAYGTGREQDRGHRQGPGGRLGDGPERPIIQVDYRAVVESDRAGDLSRPAAKHPGRGGERPLGHRKRHQATRRDPGPRTGVIPPIAGEQQRPGRRLRLPLEKSA